jgi:adenosylhomocysteine nucleosidase
MPHPSRDQAARGAVRPGGILVLAALPQEVQPFLRLMRARRLRGLGAPAWELAPGPGLVALTGMGGAAARRTAKTLVDRTRPDILVSLGFAGALQPGMAAGDLVLGESFWRYDPGTGKLRAGPAPPPPRPLPDLRRALVAAGLGAAAASLVSTTVIIDKACQGGPLAALPQPVLDLETAVLAEAAAAHGLAFLSLRAVTDTAGEEIPDFLREVGDQAEHLDLRRVLRWLAADWRRGGDLLHLWRRSRLAARRLAQALAVLWPLLSAAGDQPQDQPGQEGEIDKNPHPA